MIIRLTSTDNLTPKLNKALKALAPEARLNALNAAGRGMVNVMRSWFYGLDNERANSLSSNRSHFWGSGSQGLGGVAKSCNHVATPGSVEAMAFAPGIPGALTHKIEGGTVTPKHAKALTIPVHPDAYNRRAREIEGLKMVWPKGEPIGRLEMEGEKVYHAKEKTAAGKKKELVKRAGPLGAALGHDFTGKAVSAQRQKGAVFYLLFRSVTHNPDPSVQPPDALVFGAARDAINQYFNHVKATAQNG